MSGESSHVFVFNLSDSNKSKTFVSINSSRLFASLWFNLVIDTQFYKLSYLLNHTNCITCNLHPNNSCSNQRIWICSTKSSGRRSFGNWNTGDEKDAKRDKNSRVFPANHPVVLVLHFLVLATRTFLSSADVVPCGDAVMCLSSDWFILDTIIVQFQEKFVLISSS
jgi:hypothetical protein